MSPKRAFTYRDYEALPSDRRRYEIHDGELCVTQAPSFEHRIVLEAFALEGDRYVVAATAAGAESVDLPSFAGLVLVPETLWPALSSDR